MSTIKSYSVGHGDMFHIEHGSDNFTIIDCCLDDDTQKTILDEIASLSKQKGITRFISTHPDDDHVRGLKLLDDKISIANFYCVQNKVTKEDKTESFTRYCELRDSATKAFYIKKGCSRKWMNETDEARGSSGITILWPNPDNAHFKEELAYAEEGGSPNNISAIIKYSLDDGVTALWMGDLETAFMEAIEKELELPKVDVLFAPHHGRDSGRIPTSMLEKMSPKIIIVGEAPSEHLHYYPGYDTITQNCAGDIVFECEAGAIHIFAANVTDVDFLENRWKKKPGYHYVGTLAVAKVHAAAAA